MAVKTKKLRSLLESSIRDDVKNNESPFRLRHCRKPVRGRQFYEDLKEGLAQGEFKPHDFSIRELMEEFIRDGNGNPCGREIIDSWNMKHGGDGGEDLTQLMEAGAVQYADFSNITGQIIYNQTLEAYQVEDFTLTKLIPTVPTQFNGERIAGIGGIGDEAEAVPEAKPYPMVGVNEDWIDTPTTTKRGLILPLTKEAAFFDRTGLLLARAAEVGKYLGLNKEIRAVDCVIDENTTTPRYNRKNRGTIATYGANSGNHDFANLQTGNGLTSWVQVDLNDQLLYSILDPNTAQPIQIIGKLRLIVPRGLLRTAEYIKRMTMFRITTPGYQTTGNPVQTESPQVISDFEVVTSRFLLTRMATLTSWYYGDPETAFNYMENWPMTVVEAPANSELEFNQDIVMRWKASERGQYIVRDPRYMTKATA